MPLSQRPSSSVSVPRARGFGSAPLPTNYDAIRVRVLAKLQDRLDPRKSRRMPLSLLQQSARQQVEQVIDAEAPRLPKADRDRMIEDVLGETFGFGPLEELFRDPAAKEIMVLGPDAVLVLHNQGWLPTNVKFRDEDHLRQIIERAAIHGEAVGGALPESGMDTKLTNGFRIVAVIPPLALGWPTTATFVRVGAVPAALPTPATPLPAPRPPAVSGESPLTRHRLRITQRIVTRMASLGVYDASRLDQNELRAIIAAYVQEYSQTEFDPLSDAEQTRLVAEVIAALNR